MDSEHRYESENFEPRLTYKKAAQTDFQTLGTSDFRQTLITWLPVLLFIVGGLIVDNSKSMALASISSTDPNGGRSWNPEDLVDRNLNLKIIGAGVILYGAALLARRPAKD